MRRILPCLLLALLPAVAEAQNTKSFEKTMTVPASPVKLGWKAGKCTVERVVAKNYPDPEDVDHARSEDRDDKTWLWWEFYVTNDGDQECQVNLWVEILDKGGRVVKQSDRSGKLGRDERDDEFRVSTLARTLDIVEGKARLKVEIRQ